jgi:hypothetical protein
MLHNPDTNTQTSSPGEMTGSPSEGFTEMDDLEDNTEDNLPFVFDPNLGPSVGAAPSNTPPASTKESSNITESWVSVDVTHIAPWISRSPRIDFTISTLPWHHRPERHGQSASTVTLL